MDLSQNPTHQNYSWKSYISTIATSNASPSWRAYRWRRRTLSADTEAVLQHECDRLSSAEPSPRRHFRTLRCRNQICCRYASKAFFEGCRTRGSRIPHTIVEHLPCRVLAEPLGVVVVTHNLITYREPRFDTDLRCPRQKCCTTKQASGAFSPNWRIFLPRRCQFSDPRTRSGSSLAINASWAV